MLEKITDRIYYMSHGEETDRPALGLVVGDECCLVIDAGVSPAHAKEFQKEIAQLKVPPVKYLVLTHYHWDHSLGLGAWDAVTIAHMNSELYLDKYQNIAYDDVSLELAKNNGTFSEYAIRCIKLEIEDREHFKVGRVDLFYKDSMKIPLGNVTCELRHMESPHTDDTSIVYIPEEQVMFLGDCVYGRNKDGFNYYDNSKLFEMIAEIEQYQTQYFVCSHETINTREEMFEFWEILRSCHKVASKCSDLNAGLKEYTLLYETKANQETEFFLKSFGLR